tara:strand:- start:1328 stop:3217 length:1890 start_codon:yes stop_codon:yes gene_type:complete
MTNWFIKQIELKNKENLCITIEAKKFILITTYFSTIFFNGGGILRFQNQFYLLLSFILPLVSTIVLYYYFKNEFFSFKLKKSYIFVVAFIMLVIISQNFRNVNLFSDELFYTSRCFNIVRRFLSEVLYFEPPSILATISYGGLIRIFIIIQWLSSILILNYLMKNINKKYGLTLFIVVMGFLKLVLLYFRVESGVHPPLNYLIPSLSIGLFGFNSISIKLSIIIVHLTFILYILNRLRLSLISGTFVSLCIFSVPIIGKFSMFYDQAIYSFICFSIVLTEAYLNKLRPKYIFLIISIFVLFRYTNIAAYPLAVLYGFFFFRNEDTNYYNIVKNIVWSIIPSILSIPILFSPILLGTPSTSSLKTILNTGKNFEIFSKSLTLNYYNVFDLYLFIPLLLLFFLLLTKNFKLIVYIILTFSAYEILHQISAASVFEAKYYLEQSGFIIVFAFALMGKSFDQTSVLTNRYKLCTYLLVFLLLSSYSFVFSKNKVSKNFFSNYSNLEKDFNNHHNYLVDYIKSKNIFDQVLILGIDYGPTFLALYDVSYNDYRQYHHNSKKYIKLKQQNNIGWLEINANLINDYKSIDYIFITDHIYDSNINEIDILIDKYKWNILAALPKTYNYFKILLLKRN